MKLGNQNIRKAPFDVPFSRDNVLEEIIRYIKQTMNIEAMKL